MAGAEEAVEEEAAVKEVMVDFHQSCAHNQISSDHGRAAGEAEVKEAEFVAAADLLPQARGVELRMHHDGL